MKREKCEKLILEKLKEINDIYLEYNPKGEYLNLSIIVEKNKSYLSFNNQYYEEDKKNPIDVWVVKIKENKK